MRRNKVDPIDENHTRIINSADTFSAVAFQPGFGQIHLISMDNMEGVRAYAEAVLNEVNRYRSIAIYGSVEATGEVALCGTYNVFDKTWKPTKRA